MVDYILPEKVVSNDELKSIFPDFDSEKLSGKIGIDRRHVAAPGETALDLAYKASSRILEKSGADIDFILLCTQSPDYLLPSSACILQDRLGLDQQTGAMDFSLGCSGFVYGLGLAKGLILGNMARNVLLVTAETYSKHIHPGDKANRGIFGDAAAAAVISACGEEKIGEFVFGTDGSGFEQLIVKNSGQRNRDAADPDEYTYGDGNITSDAHLYMNGPDIFNFTIETIPGIIEETLEKNRVTREEVDYYILHQANQFMLDYLRRKIKVGREKFYNNIREVGNTVSATIPIGLTESLGSGTIKKGDRVLVAGFGVGLSWGATMITV